MKKLDQLVTAKAGFSRSYMVTGQTYTRKVWHISISGYQQYIFLTIRWIQIVWLDLPPLELLLTRFAQTSDSLPA